MASSWSATGLGSRKVAEGRPHWGMAASWPTTGLGQGKLQKDGHTGEGGVMASWRAGASDVAERWPHCSTTASLPATGWSKWCCEGMATLGHDGFMAGQGAGARDVAKGWPHWGMTPSLPAIGLGQGMFRRDGHTAEWQLHGQPQGWGKGRCGGTATVRHGSIKVSLWVRTGDIVEGRPQGGTTVWLIPGLWQCCGSGMSILDPGSQITDLNFYPSRIPESRIQKEQQKRGVKKN
jgi:hypothetical protein